VSGPRHVEHPGWSAAADLGQAVSPGRPELSDLVLASRLRTVGRAALLIALLVVIGAVSFAAASVTGTAGLRWLTGGILVVLLASTWLLCAHAGGHAWFVPVPALVLAALWALTVSPRQDGPSWWLVAMSATTAGGGVVVAGTALRQRLRSPSPAVPRLEGAMGVAVTPLAPRGVVRVASETFTARSLSGSLPAGAPVHVVRVDGVRLDVWSEVGTVPDDRMLDIEEE
jgi:membrane protein implicated in regulation of membrane protease activity